MGYVIGNLVYLSDLMMDSYFLHASSRYLPSTKTMNWNRRTRVSAPSVGKTSSENNTNPHRYVHGRCTAERAVVLINSSRGRLG
ncbi:hypothetical protein BDW02DRAFT_178182 [Decorospora gaudefroyi]|uniref:Uncharacterized protein n=1 Tax=Decorospora gaudefroyi TaxID=184978 RepID=A0A6A5K3M3_9PLEO|nr:hypothetical protein BDW02DRAFT_178182 [Decorospora gaudefroyi]